MRAIDMHFPKQTILRVMGGSLTCSVLLPFFPWRKAMEGLTRATFNAARDGDPSAVLLMEQAASEGSKDAEGILLQLTRECMAASGESDFAVAFERTAAANEKLHLSYLNSNGVQRY